MTRSAKVVSVVFCGAIATMLVVGFVGDDSRWRERKQRIKKEQTYYEEVAQPRIYIKPGVHEAPTYHLQAHHDQILLKLREIEKKVDAMAESLKEDE